MTQSEINSTKGNLNSDLENSGLENQSIPDFQGQLGNSPNHKSKSKYISIRKEQNEDKKEVESTIGKTKSSEKGSSNTNEKETKSSEKKNSNDKNGKKSSNKKNLNDEKCVAEFRENEQQIGYKKQEMNVGNIQHHLNFVQISPQKTGITPRFQKVQQILPLEEPRRTITITRNIKIIIGLFVGLSILALTVFFAIRFLSPVPEQGTLQLMNQRNIMLGNMQMMKMAIFNLCYSSQCYQFRVSFKPEYQTSDGVRVLQQKNTQVKYEISDQSTGINVRIMNKNDKTNSQAYVQEPKLIQYVLSRQPWSEIDDIQSQSLKGGDEDNNTLSSEQSDTPVVTVERQMTYLHSSLQIEQSVKQTLKTSNLVQIKTIESYIGKINEQTATVSIESQSKDPIQDSKGTTKLHNPQDVPVLKNYENMTELAQACAQVINQTQQTIKKLWESNKQQFEIETNKLKEETKLEATFSGKQGENLLENIHLLENGKVQIPANYFDQDSSAAANLLQTRQPLNPADASTTLIIESLI